MVSHDRRFLEAVTTRTVAFHEGVVDVYPGGFRDYADVLARKQEAEAAVVTATRTKSERPKAAPRPEPVAKPAEPSHGRAVRRSGSTKPESAVAPAPVDRKTAFVSEKAAARERERKARRVKVLEEAIAKEESALSELREELKKDPAGDWAKLASLAREEQALAKKLDEIVSEWMALSEELANDPPTTPLRGEA